MKNILFQGDSITDCQRDRTTAKSSLGTGYPLLVSSALGFENGNIYEFMNRGISGNRIVDLYARIKADIINLKPDIMSILIGVNDVWHEINYKNGVDSEKFFKIYCMLIEEIKEALPDVKIMILEPFVLEGSATCNCEEVPDKLNLFKTGVAEKAEMAKKVAQKYNLTFIPLQEKFNEAEKIAPQPHWLYDGVHPTPFGHELIKREWLKAFKSL